ncbi:MAG TPA: hypothetical protein VGJ01_00190, partial [Pseudolabrys sp.]
SCSLPPWGLGLAFEGEIHRNRSEYHGAGQGEAGGQVEGGSEGQGGEGYEDYCQPFGQDGIHACGQERN